MKITGYEVTALNVPELDPLANTLDDAGRFREREVRGAGAVRGRGAARHLTILRRECYSGPAGADTRRRLRAACPGRAFLINSIGQGS